VAGYKISYKILHEQGHEYTAISKEVGMLSEDLLAVQKQLSEHTMMDSVRTSLSLLINQVKEIQITMKTAGDKLVTITEKYQSSETKVKETITQTGVSKKDFYGSVDSLGKSSGGTSTIENGANTMDSQNSINGQSNANGENSVRSDNNVESGPKDVSVMASQVSPEKIGLKDLDPSVLAAGLAASVAAGAIAGTVTSAIGNSTKKKSIVEDKPAHEPKRESKQEEYYG